MAASVHEVHESGEKIKVLLPVREFRPCQFAGVRRQNIRREQKTEQESFQSEQKTEQESIQSEQKTERRPALRFLF